jgi:hypothetical protein
MHLFELGDAYIGVIGNINDSNLTQQQNPYFIIGRETSEFLKVEVLNYERPENSDYWDANWLKVQIQIKVGAFSGNYIAQLQTMDFSGFEKELKRIYIDLKGVTQFNSIEEWLMVMLIGDGLGHFKVECRACDSPGTGNTLQFEFQIDQTYIPNLITQVSNILEMFPVKGQPNRA